MLAWGLSVIPMKPRLAFIAVLLLVAIGGAAAASGTNASLDANSTLQASVSPTSPFYGLHIAYDRLRLALARSDQAKADLALAFANERLAEVQLMATKGRIGQAERAQRLHDRFLAAAQKAASVNGSNATRQYAGDIALEEQLAIHRAELERLRNVSEGNLTAQQRAALDAILANSQLRLDNFTTRLEDRRTRLRAEIESKGGNATLARLDASRYQHLALVAQRQARLAIANADRLLARVNSTGSFNASAGVAAQARSGQPSRSEGSDRRGPTGREIDVNAGLGASGEGANASINASGSEGSGSESSNSSEGSGSSDRNGSSEGSGSNGSEGAGSEGGLNASLNSTESEGSGSESSNSSERSGSSDRNGSSEGSGSRNETEAPENATVDEQARIDLEDGMTNATVSLLASYNLTLPAINGSGIAVGEAFVARAKDALATSESAYAAKDYARSYAYARYSHLLAVHAMWAARSHPALAAKLSVGLQNRIVTQQDDLRARFEAERSRLQNRTEQVRQRAEQRRNETQQERERLQNRTEEVRQQVEQRRNQTEQRIAEVRNRNDSNGSAPIPIDGGARVRAGASANENG